VILDQIKPEIMAPSESIPTWTRGGSLVTSSGTSMASPLISGLIGLLWSFKLKNNIKLTREYLLNNTIRLDGKLNFSFYFEDLSCNSKSSWPNYNYGKFNSLIISV
jgi:subtilisin family serine protease